MNDEANNIDIMKTVGILGGGQLGMMSAMAAKSMDIDTIIYCPEENSPASSLSKETINADYSNEGKLKEFADKVDVISFEFENIPIETVNFLKKHKPVYPDPMILEMSQDRATEKKYLNDLGVATVQWSLIDRGASVHDIINDMSSNEFIFKTRRFGYDGKGQIRVGSSDRSLEKLSNLNLENMIVEECIDFSCEISVVISRDKLGNMALYGPMLNEHKNHILRRTIVPAPVSDDIKNRSRDLAKRLADATNLRGVITLEMFVTKDGEILANEIAPRTHNSGHWTIDGCNVSQFEQHIRTICGMNVKEVDRYFNIEMINLIGDDVKNLGKWEEMDNAKIHLYGKNEIRDGRKMGHVTIIKPIA
jgi:5-(carboxyamino)imidazole ribonucleotide synthase